MNTRKLKVSIVFFLFALNFTERNIFAATIYVDINALGDNNGSTWANAYTSFAEALNSALAADEIRVAHGTYRPNDGIIPTGDERKLTFQLKNGVAVKGGYAGYNQPDPNARDIELHRTILSGDVGVINVGTDNSYHVVQGEDNATLDGFTIINGYSVNAAGNYSYGAGMYNYRDANVMITNCTFEYNLARFGGGMYNYDSSVKLINCVFCDNSAVYDGGAFRDVYGVSTINNCTFYSNVADTGNGGYVGGGIANFDNDSIITNCIFSNNSDNGGIDESAQIYANGGTQTVSYSCIQGLDTFAGNGNIDSDPFFANTGRCDFHLQSQAGRWNPSSQSWVIDSITSPCIDAGNPGSPIESEPVPNGNRINMGAYGGTPTASKSPSNWRSIADLTNDNIVNGQDLAVFANYWLGSGLEQPADIDRNEVVDFADFAIFARDWLWQK